MKKVFSLLLAAAFVAASSTAVFAAQIFSDVPENYWAKDPIEEAYSDGAIAGKSFNEATGERVFGIRDTLSFAQFSAILCRIYFKDEYDAAKKKGTAWTDNAYEIVKAHSLWNHEISREDFSKDIKRQDMASLLANITKASSAFTISDAELKASEAKIKDLDSIPKEYRNDVLFAYTSGLILGYADGTFGGDRYMNRSEACAVYVREKNLTAGASSDLDEKPADSGVVTIPEEPKGEAEDNFSAYETELLHSVISTIRFGGSKGNHTFTYTQPYVDPAKYHLGVSVLVYRPSGTEWTKDCSYKNDAGWMNIDPSRSEYDPSAHSVTVKLPLSYAASTERTTLTISVITLNGNPGGGHDRSVYYLIQTKGQEVEFVKAYVDDEKGTGRPYLYNESDIDISDMFRWK